MILPNADSQKFFHIWMKLLNYANKKLKVYPKIGDISKPTDLPMKKAAKLRDRLWEHPQLIDGYLEEYGHNLSQEEVAMVNSWKDRVSGRFIILKQLKKHAIFIHLDDGEQIYGVLGLKSSMAEMTQIIDMPFPLMVNAVLLPFDGKIVYDGFLTPYDVSFGRGVRSDLNDLYRDAKSENQIIVEIMRD